MLRADLGSVEKVRRENADRAAKPLQKGSQGNRMGKIAYLAPARLHSLDTVGALRGCALQLALKRRPQQRLLRAQLQHLL